MMYTASVGMCHLRVISPMPVPKDLRRRHFLRRSFGGHGAGIVLAVLRSELLHIFRDTDRVGCHSKEQRPHNAKV